MSEAVLIAFAALVAAAAFRLAGVAAGAQQAVVLRFPRGLRTDQAVAAVRALSGLRGPWWRRVFASETVTLEHRATEAGIVHLLFVPAGRREFVVGALRAALPGLRVADAPGTPMPSVRLARELGRMGEGSLRTETADTNAGILASLQPLRADEAVVVQEVIAPVGWRGRWLRQLVRAFGEVPEQAARPGGEPEFAVALRVGVAAQPDRSRQVMARVLGSLHALGTPEARLSRRLLPSALVRWRLARRVVPDGAAVLAADEAAGLVGMPLGETELPGLTLAGSRELAVQADVPRIGLVLGHSTIAPSRPVAVAFDQIKRGLHVCAPTGGGKSTVLTHLAQQVMAAGHGLAVIDTKGDTAESVLGVVPPGRRGDVVVFDPADEAPVGFNVIGGSEESELVVDHVVSGFRARYGAAGLGPRSEDILRCALRTLANAGDYTLCEVEPLLTNPAFRARLVGRVEEPVLEQFWAWFGSLSEAARAEAVAPLANKLRSYTLRRRVRAVVGQTGGLDFVRALREGQVVIVSLAKGVIGEDTAALIGSAMTARLWAAIQGRAAVPETERRPFVVVADEFADYAAHGSFEMAVSASRGYGVAWCLAHQHLAQLDPAVRQSVLANCRSRLVLQTTAADAAAFAREFAPHLTAADLQGLGPFEGYAAVSTGSAVAPPASIRTRPAPRPVSSPAALRAASRARYGRPPAEVEQAIQQRVLGSRPAAPVGGIRRAS